MKKNIRENQATLFVEKLAWLPILFLFITILVLKIADNQTVYILPNLQMVLNLLTRTLPFLLIIYLIGRSYLYNGMTGHLFLSYGVFILLITGYISTQFVTKEANLSITINNIGIWLSSLCQLTGSILLIFSKKNTRFKIIWLVSGYLLSLSIVGFLTLATFKRWLPVFFIQGHGGTMARHSVLISAVALFVLAVILLWESNRKPLNPFIYWYTLSMLLITIGVIGLIIESSANSLLDWTCRAAQYLSGIYMLIAAITSRQNSDLYIIKQTKIQNQVRFKYSVAIAIVLASVALRFTFLHGLGTRVAFLTLYPAVIIAALYGGYRAGILASFLSAFVADYFWLEPVGFILKGSSEYLSITVFLISCIMISFITESMHQAKARATKAETEARFADERQRTSEMLLESEERFRILVENMQEYAVFMLDDKGYVFNWNIGAERLKGYKAKEIIGKHFSCFYIPEESGKADLELEIAAKKGYFIGEGLRVRKDGSRFWASITITALVDKNGVLRGYSKIVHDITEQKNAENSLRESEQKYRSIVETAEEGIVLAKPEGNYIFINKKMTEMLGYRIDEILGKSSSDFTFEDFKPQVLNVRNETAKGHPLNGEFKFRRKDGSALWSSYNVSPVFDDSERHVANLAMHTDITEQKRAEEALWESEEKYRLIIEHAPTAIYEIDFIEKRFKTVNDGMCKMLGYTEEELLAMNPLDILDDESVKLFNERLNNAQAGEIPSMSIEYKGKMKDGKMLWGILNSKFKYCNGKITGAFVVAYDITDRKKAEDELRETRNYLENLFDYANAPIIVWDSNFKITRFNHAFEKMTGYKSEDVIGKNLQILFPDESITESLQKIERTATGEYWDSIEIPIQQKVGEIKIALWNSANIYDKDGKTIISTIAQGQDITDRKKSELEMNIAKETAEKANQAKNLFIANMSHELRTPLNAILGYTQLLKKSGELTEKQLDSIDVMYNSGRHLLSMINDLLDLSKIEAGRMNLENKAFPLPDLLKRVTDIIRLQSEEKKLEFIFNVKSEIPVNVIGDEKRLSQILLNLLSNAVKFTDNGGISLKVEKLDKNLLRFEVEDTGIGILQENMEIIFYSFYQLDSGKSKTKGTGLGLTISQSLVRLMGSELYVKSEIGKGSTFWFDINFNLFKEEYAAVESMTFSKKTLLEDLPDDIRTPAEEELKALNSFVKIGDIINIRKYIDKIEKENPEFKQFASRLKLLARNINLAEIEKLIRKYLKE